MFCCTGNNNFSFKNLKCIVEILSYSYFLIHILWFFSFKLYSDHRRGDKGNRRNLESKYSAAISCFLSFQGITCWVVQLNNALTLLPKQKIKISILSEWELKTKIVTFTGRRCLCATTVQWKCLFTLFILVANLNTDKLNVFKWGQVQTNAVPTL